MPKRFEGTSVCSQHGVFSWKMYALNNGEAVVGKISDWKENCRNITKQSDKYIIEVYCPVCKKSFFEERR